MNLNDEYIRTGYLDRKSGSGSAYNYDLFPLIKDFSFHEFVYDGIKNSEYLSDYGGFLVITGKQYIIGYNAGFGTGTHIAAFARVMKDLTSSGLIVSDQEAVKLAGNCKRQFLTARIIYEKVSDDPAKYKGYLSFNISENKITPSQFLVFKTFYEDYNNEIKSVVNKYGKDNFKVTFPYKDNGEDKTIVSDSLDELYQYLESHIDYTTSLSFENENIIGKEIKPKTI